MLLLVINITHVAKLFILQGQSSRSFLYVFGAAPLYDEHRGRQEDCAGVLDGTQ